MAATNGSVVVPVGAPAFDMQCMFERMRDFAMAIQWLWKIRGEVDLYLQVEGIEPEAFFITLKAGSQEVLAIWTPAGVETEGEKLLNLGAIGNAKGLVALLLEKLDA